MADTKLAARTALAHIAVPARLGRLEGDPGVILTAIDDLALFLLIARKGQAAAVRTRAEALGQSLPDDARLVGGAPFEVMWAGPEQWLVVAPRPSSQAAERFVASFAQSCMTVELSDARAVIEVSGPRARECLVKLCGIDLHPRAFRPGDVALTPVGGVPSQLWQVDAAPTYRTAVPRSYAESVWHGFREAALEYGLKVNG